ncbi:branched-chain amino acid ABC transporter permease [Paracoccus sp. MBLB3053]|uniref:Branched-chain amino acid ABC transporter permease n=1 Tax=Paracoccus aurantius TaxID=3073814 RepID=A0ABU2HYS3_9RHOB|nr:branched-chain amino acid ABC transporter permease [Paracoccus sp. MBLB3053]MDS9469650.1 branched-chain amino acid ABC transporter permease [Paracoccus sp. MBLB3053]
MDYVAIILLQTTISIANLVLISAGLAVIFGMMRVINFAHGEFLMLGGYTAVIAAQHGVPLLLSCFVLAPILVGLVGLVVEYLVIRHLYGRLLDTMLATWGVSLILIGLVTVSFGNSVSGISTPFGSVAIGRFTIGLYELFLVAVTIALVVAGYLVMRFSRIGLIARATMQDREMAEALGINQRAVYRATFVTGAALSGFAGALIAPIAGVVPTIGASYLAKCFITVISGGPAIIAGTLSASGLLGGVNVIMTFLSTPVLAEVALLATAVILLRVLPQGITSKFFRRSQ